jgi:SAM-dependent methyltransferase
MLPTVPVKTVLEVGCAEGHFTRLLAERVQEVVACDISDLATHRAQQTCEGLRNVRFLTMDVRGGLPQENFDLILFSDVLYYLSSKEAVRVLANSAEVLRPGAFLMFANEWHAEYRFLLEPTEILKIINRSEHWELMKRQDFGGGGSRTLLAALFRRSSLRGND